MSNYNAKDMFQLQSELIEVKVDMAVSKAIDRVVDQITELRGDIHHLDKRLAATEAHMDKRFAATEASLNNLQKITAQVGTRLLDYGMKAMWTIVASSCVYAATLIINHFIK